MTDQKQYRPITNTHKIGSFLKGEAERLRKKLEGKTYMSFGVTVAPCGGEWTVTINTTYDCSHNEFIGMVVYAMACMLDEHCDL